MVKLKAPWLDFAGNEIHEGDTLRHPSGETGVVVFMPSHENPWRVEYGDGVTLWLGNQIGDKGMAVVCIK